MGKEHTTMTNQESFDKVMTHLRSLPERSMAVGGEDCVYNGSMCAIGALMTDEEQTRYGEYTGPVRSLLVEMRRDGHTSMLHPLDEELLSDMQALHDASINWGFEEGFRGEGSAEDLAELHNLYYTAPKT
jgi:hypothetical protein